MDAPNNNPQLEGIYIHHLDLRDVLSKIELSFEIKFEEDFYPVEMTIHEVTEIVLSRLDKKPTKDRTAIAFFFRFRKVLIERYGFSKNAITPTTDLAVVFPNRSRKKRIKEVEQALGIQTNIVGANAGPILLLILSIILSVIILFFTFFVGLGLLVVSLVALKAVVYFGNALYVNTVKEYVHRVIQSNYFQARKDTTTYNPDEVKRIIKDMFLEEIEIEGTDENILDRRIKIS